ncbi:MAG: pilus assembly protein FimV [Candidatus Endobugula sp.]|jgi:pilus assembly protein FimV
MLLGHSSTLVVILVSIFACSYSLSLGLGEVTLKSSYNEPLVDELKIIQAEGLFQSEILLALASREDFSRVGIDRVFFSLI